MAESGTIRAVGPSKDLLERALRTAETSFRVALTESDIDGARADEIAAKAAQMVRQGINQIIWDAYREGVKRKEVDG